MFISRGKTKARSLPGPSILFIESERPVGTYPWIDTFGFVSTTGGTQITESDGNRWPPPKGDLRDSGSEFYTRKCEILTGQFPYHDLYFKAVGSEANDHRSRGRFLVANCFIPPKDTTVAVGGKRPLALDFPDLSSSRSSLNIKGQAAVVACMPGNQIASAATAIGELLQDVPKIPGTALWKARLRAVETLAAGGEEFLNYIFGISPTVGDMGDFLSATHKVDKLVSQFVRDSGKVVRRQFHYPTEKTTTEEVVAGRYSPVGANSGGTAHILSPIGISRNLPIYQTIRVRTVERKIWFSGAFTYHLPNWYDNGSESDRRRLMAQFFGAKPDLETLWNLAPWSWAVDWLVNAGSFLKSVNSLIQYGTVMRYGYVMEECTVTDTYKAGAVSHYPDSAHSAVNKPPYPTVHDVTLRVTTKKRIQANPFGFGLNWDGLSSTQQAIVAALGITRVVR